MWLFSLYLKPMDKVYVHQLEDLKAGGFTTLVKITGLQFGVDAAAYATGDVLGDKAPIKISCLRSTTGTGILHSLIVQDLSNQSGDMDFVIFDSNPTASTFTDNLACDIADGDLPKVIGVISVVAADYDTFADNAIATKTSIGLALKTLDTDSINLWIVPVSRAAKTYVADELSVIFGVLQD